VTRRARAWLVAALLVGAGGPHPAPNGGVPAADVEVPVALNADSPFGYPPALYDRGIEGEVVLHLYVDSTGRLVPESTRIEEPSGTPALDSAALAGAPGLRFAPATRRGVPIGAGFLQPVRFRRTSAPAAAGTP
jgi:TonB family protein